MKMIDNLPSHKNAGRFHVRLLAALLLFTASTLASAATVTDMSFSTGPGGRVNVVLTIDGAMPEPAVFSTEDPPRLAVDLSATNLDIEERTLQIGSGATRSVSAVESGDRTRVVINLFRQASYDVSTAGDVMTITVSGGQQTTSSTLNSSVSRRLGETLSDAAITKVDFRRGMDGEGRVVVSLSDSDATADMRVEGGEIIVDFFNTEIDASLERRLDVMDFATPVQLIDVFSRGENVRMRITAGGDFEQLTYQSSNEYVVEISPVQENVIEEAEIAATDQPEYSGQRVTFNFQDIPVRSVLQLIADVSNLNVVVSDSVTGSLTLRLNNVPWDQALDIILRAKGLDKRPKRLADLGESNVIIVGPAAELAEQERLVLEQDKQKQSLEPLQVAYIQVNYAKAVDLRDLLLQREGTDDALISERGSVTVDERTNTLLITDTGSKIEGVRELIALLDRPVQQVQIEARIVIASSDFRNQLGARFGVSAAHEDSRGNLLSTSGSLNATDRLSNAGLLNRYNSTGTGQSSLPVFVPSPVSSDPLASPLLGERLNVNLPISNPAGRFGFSILTGDYLLDLELSALEAEGRGEVISSPRMITANQTEAFIRQGVEIPFQQSTSSGATSITFKEAVLELRAQPLITPDERIRLDLDVKQDTVGELVPTGLGGTAPSIDTRQLATSVLVDNGQTVVLGGIYEWVRRQTDNKVPYLGDIPGLGVLFRQTDEENDKAELLIFVTPTILNESLGYQ